MPEDLNVSLYAILPLIVLTAWVCALLLVDLFIPKARKGLTALFAAVGLLVTLGFVIARFGHPIKGFGGMIFADDFANFLNVLLLVSGLAGVGLAHDYLKRIGLERGEYYALLLFSLIGMMLMGMTADLIVVFLALELLSIPLYVLAGIATPKPSSEEAGLKYFLLGAFASGFVLFGIALVYGATGFTGLTQIVESIGNDQANLTWLLTGAALILMGLGFKVAVVPFHMWTPDVYHGAPTSVTAFMAVGAKAAGFAAILRIFLLAFPSLATDLAPVLWGLAAATMVLGNVVAIAQTNIKRLLAYSSIAHAGYIMMALVPYGHPQVVADSTASALFYLAAYAFTNFAAWAVVIAVERQGDEEGNRTGNLIEDFAGLGRKNPGMAAVMAIAMLSFTGVPPTLGFVGKFFLFRTAVEGGFLGLALLGVLTSLVSAYYYLRVVVVMYMKDGEPQVRQEAWLYLTAYVAAAGVIVLSILSTPLIRWATEAVLRLI